MHASAQAVEGGCSAGRGIALLRAQRLSMGFGWKESACRAPRSSDGAMEEPRARRANAGLDRRVVVAESRGERRTSFNAVNET